MTDNTTEAGGLSKESYVSIGLVTILIGAFVTAALWVTSQVGDIRTLVLPKVARIESDISTMVRDVAEIREWKNRLPSASDIQLLIDRAIKAHQVESMAVIDTKLEMLSERMRRIEGRDK